MKRKTVLLFLYLLLLSCVHIEVAAKNLHHRITPQHYDSNKKITTYMRRGGGGHGGGGSHGGSGGRGGSSSRGGGSRGVENRGTGGSSVVPRGGIYPYGYPYYGSTRHGKHNSSRSCGINHHRGGAFTVIVALTALTLIWY